MTGEFTTVYGRNLVAELPAFVNLPYLVVTMDDERRESLKLAVFVGKPMLVFIREVATVFPNRHGSSETGCRNMSCVERFDPRRNHT